MQEPMIAPTPESQTRWEELRIECVTFDPAGLPKRRRLVSCLAMRQPLAPRPELTRRRVLAKDSPHI